METTTTTDKKYKKIMTEVSDNNSNTDKGQRHDQSWGMATIATMPKEDDDDNDNEDEEVDEDTMDVVGLYVWFFILPSKSSNN